MPGMYHMVERPFRGAVPHPRGEALRPDELPHGRKLIDQRFISAGAIEGETTACGCGRYWVGEVADHDCAGKTRTRTTQPVRGGA